MPSASGAPSAQSSDLGSVFLYSGRPIRSLREKKNRRISSFHPSSNLPPPVPFLCSDSVPHNAQRISLPPAAFGCCVLQHCRCICMHFADSLQSLNTTDITPHAADDQRGSQDTSALPDINTNSSLFQGNPLCHDGRQERRAAAAAAAANGAEEQASGEFDSKQQQKGGPHPHAPRCVPVPDSPAQGKTPC